MSPLTVSKILLLGLLAGAAIWFWLFALAFTRSHADYWASAILPFCVEAVAAGLLGFFSRRLWYFAAVGIVAPVMLMNLMFFSMVYADGRGAEWSCIWSIGVVCCVACAAGFIGSVIAPDTKTRRA